MPIQFNDGTIPGTVLAPGPSQSEPHVAGRDIVRSGVRGKEKIAWLVGDSTISVYFLLHNNFTEDGIKAEIDRLRRLAGSSGTVDFQTPARPSHKFGNCIFLGPRTLPGKDNGPVNDHAGAIGGWWQIIQLSWEQLDVD